MIDDAVKSRKGRFRRWYYSETSKDVKNCARFEAASSKAW